MIDTADKGCNVDWTLIAAIGRVESDHGRYGGNTLSDKGVSTPGIYGIPLDGSSGTAKISDTDAGELDDDPVFDRAVGPMQFIPSTWSVVGVDGDGDGVRNPQDIDDAALATAVYLCSGTEDLSTTQGLRTAVYRYNHSQEYVDLVLSIMKAYAEGDYSSVPNGSASPATFSPVATGPRAEGRPSRPADRPGSKGGSSGGSTSGGGQGGSGTSSTPTGGSTPTAPAPGGGTGGTGGGSTGGGGGGGGSIPTDAPTGSVDRADRPGDGARGDAAGAGDGLLPEQPDGGRAEPHRRSGRMHRRLPRRWRAGGAEPAEQPARPRDRAVAPAARSGLIVSG